jgi:glyoxylate reductase
MRVEAEMAESVYVTRVIPQPGIDILREQLEVEVNEGDEPLTSDQLRGRAASHPALVTLLTDRIDRSVLEAGRGNLRIVANVAVGYDNIDVAAASKLGILVSNTPGVLTDTTADFAWTLLMAAARRVNEAERFLRAGKFHGWGIMMMLGQDIHHKTLGLVGFGRIGQGMARRATGFGMRILYFDPVTQADDVAAEVGAEQVNLDLLLRESDFISLHTPLTPDTHHLIGAKELRSMKPSAILINTSRGPVVDEAALAEALREGVIAGAGLDVYEREPDVEPGLLALENVVLAPHIASASVATRTRMATIAAENVIAVLRGGDPPTLVNPETRAKRDTS